MKKLTIGRNNACDIVIPDTSDIVSRKQAVLAVSFFGKMVLYDTSNNGTFINGQRLEHGKGRIVTRKDKVNFARVADLDWATIRDPYRHTKLAALIGIIVALIAVLMAVWLLTCPAKTPDEPIPPPTTETKTDNSVTSTTAEPAQPVQTSPSKHRASRKKHSTPKKPREEKDPVKEISTKEVNEKTPIVY